VPASLARIVDTLDLETLKRVPAGRLALNGIGRVEIETAVAVAFDPYVDNRTMGGFILIDEATSRTVAAGMATQGLDRATNVHHQHADVTPALREQAKGQRAVVVWLTGLPGSGKSTIANAVERKLAALGRQTMLLDGDNLRMGLNADLGFDPAARSENVRRVGEVAKLMVDAGLIVIVALVSPFRADRRRAAALLPEGRFIEVFVDTPPDVCRARDPKGIYAKADSGKVANFTGRDQPYEAPEKPDLVLRTVELPPEEAADRVIARIGTGL
jgi:bifunctional enzyme CysN/CysC